MLQQAPEAPSLLTAGALHWLGVLELCLGTLEESRRHQEEAISLCRSVADDRLLGEGLYRVGLTALFQGDLSALPRFTDTLAELAERVSDQRLRGLARSNRSFLAAELGDVAMAISLADEALEIMRQVGDAYVYGFFQNVRGEMARLAGDGVRAKIAYEEELRVAEQLGCKRFLAVGNANLGQVSADQDDWRDARQRLRIALQIQQGLGERRNMPTALLSAAEAVMHLGDPELAARSMGAADASRFPSQFMASDRGPTERFRRAIAKQIPSELRQRLCQEGAKLTLEEAVLRLLAYTPSRS